MNAVLVTMPAAEPAPTVHDRPRGLSQPVMLLLAMAAGAVASALYQALCAIPSLLQCEPR